MQIILYKRSFAVKDSPVSLSLAPFPSGSVCTFPVGERVYEARYSQVRVVAPDDAKVDLLRNRVTWASGPRRVTSTAREVFDLAHAGSSGFRLGA